MYIDVLCMNLIVKCLRNYVFSRYFYIAESQWDCISWLHLGLSLGVAVISWCHCWWITFVIGWGGLCVIVCGISFQLLAQAHVTWPHMNTVISEEDNIARLHAKNAVGTHWARKIKGSTTVTLEGKNINVNVYILYLTLNCCRCCPPHHMLCTRVCSTVMDTI